MLKEVIKMSKITEYPKTSSLSTIDTFLVDGPSGTRGIIVGDLALSLLGQIGLDDYFDILDSGYIPVEIKRKMWRGKYLGTSVTDDQYAGIAAGTFTGLFVGDYWILSNVVFRIVDLDYWLTIGDNPCVTHHIVVMPDSGISELPMQPTNATVSGDGYANCDMRRLLAEGYSGIYTPFNMLFGSTHLLNHRESLCNAINADIPVGSSWYDSTIEIPSEIMIFGYRDMSPDSSSNDSSSTKQLSAFCNSPSLYTSKANKPYWLRDSINKSQYACVLPNGSRYAGYASGKFSVRPVVGITG